MDLNSNLIIKKNILKVTQNIASFILYVTIEISADTANSSIDKNGSKCQIYGMP